MAPTFDTTSTFDDQFQRLTPTERKAFQAAIAKFVEDLRAHRNFRRSLRVKSYQGLSGVFELTWAPDGRALFAYGEPMHKGEAHVIWLQVGGHEIFKRGK